MARGSGGSSVKSSRYLGVTRHINTGRYEAHMWDCNHVNDCSKSGRSKGKQIYLGCFVTAEEAARAFDLALLRFRGEDTELNFPVENYAGELQEIMNSTPEELVLRLRRESYRSRNDGDKCVTRHSKTRRWESRIALGDGKYQYLGLFNSKHDAALAYGQAARLLRGGSTVTNFQAVDAADDDQAWLEQVGCREEEDGFLTEFLTPRASSVPLALDDVDSVQLAF